MTAPLAHVGREASALIHAFEVAVEDFIREDGLRFSALLSAKTTRGMYDVLKRRADEARTKRDAARSALVNLIYRNENEARS